MPLRVIQAQRLTGRLQEVHQFVDFQKSHERVQQAAEITVHQPHQSRPSVSNFGHIA